MPNNLIPVDESLNKPVEKKTKTWRRELLEWLATLAFGAVVLAFLAPSSWWQIGVSPSANRKTSAAFSLKQLGEGPAFNLAEKRGKVIVVNYWATWCGPCRFETPSLVNISNEYRERGVEMFGVTMDDNLEDVPPFITKYQISYPILLPGNDPNLGTEGTVLPTTFLYDRERRIAKKYTGVVMESTLKSDIEELLAESSAK